MLYALRLVRAHTGRDRIIKLEGAYHGCLDEVLFHSSFGSVEDWSGDVPAPDTPGIPAGYGQRVVIVPYNDIDAMAETAAALHDEVAAIVVEPVMRGLAPAPGYLAAVREIADRWELPLVFDEVITGFRLALGGAQEFYGVPADLTVLGKGLGGGHADRRAGRDRGDDGLARPGPARRPADPGRGQLLRQPGVGGGRGRRRCASCIAPACTSTCTGPGTRSGTGWLRRSPTGACRSRSPASGRWSSSTCPTSRCSTTSRRSGPTSGRRSRWPTGCAARGVFGGGGRYNVSLAHGEAEVDLLIAAVETRARRGPGAANRA